MKKISEEVMRVLDAAAVDGNIVRITSGQLDRKLYVEVNKVLESLGGKWNKGKKGHLFPSDPADIFDEVLLTGEYSPNTKKKDFGSFFTPDWLAEKVVKMADIREGMKILEPSAGAGAIAGAVLLLHPKSAPYIDLIEIQKENCDVLCDKGYRNVLHIDFLTVEPSLGDHYDRIVMNPPFAKRADVKHVLKAFDLLAPGGRLVSIMSSGVWFRDDYLTKELRTLIDECGGIEDVPEGAFKESGTMVRTVIVTLDKAA